MIIDSFKWMYEIFNQQGVELIINAGDLFHSHTIKSEEITAISEAYSYSYGVEELHILGNHEIYDSNSNFYSTALLNNFPFITVYDYAVKFKDLPISLLPYRKSELITEDLLKSLSNEILVSHIDINGSFLKSNTTVDFGTNTEILINNFNLVMNGHFHGAEVIKTRKNKIYNFGSLTSLSFSDSENYIPGICIYNTNTKELFHIDNPYSILFRKLEIDNIEELKLKIKSKDTYRYIYRIISPFNLREEVQKELDNQDNILAYRIITNMSEFKKDTNIINEVLNSKQDMKEEFKEFLKTDIKLNYPLNLYQSILNEI
jgi:DNA repair exonuclease SbcCD nuclease subunit